MRNIKIENKFVGHEYWPGVAFVDITGKADTNKFPRDGTEEEMEDVIQSWNDIVVLRATPDVAFKFGYMQGNAFHYLKEVIRVDKDNQFAVRLGDNDVRFFVLPTGLDVDMKLELVEVTKETNSKYKDLPLY